MANVLDSTKSTLGRLLAAEDIRIEHRQVRGPFFDVKARVLVLPIWKEMSSDLYDLMIGHEVGHALFTPAEGWTDKVLQYGAEFKTFLNLVEDARIEKKMKVKYPGIRRPMYDGYTELVNRGFFGVTLDDMKNLPFPDRANVYFKLGARANVTFSEKEQSIVDRIEAVENFEDVLTLAKEFYDMAKNEKSELDDIFEDLMDILEGDGDRDSSGDGGETDTDTDMDFNSTDDGNVQGVIDKLREAGKHDMADALETASEKMRDRLLEWMQEQDPSSITQDSLDMRQEDLIDDGAYPFTYAHFPNINTKHFVVPHQKVHDMMVFDSHIEDRRMEIYNKFMNTNKKYIAHMVKEFELRRNAKQFARAKTSKTGELDMNRIWSHKLSENLFLQTTSVPDGKNHGMIMLVDMSSSMHENISGTLEQLITLVMFCRRVNIPFDVYGFFDTYGAEKEIENWDVVSRIRNDESIGAIRIDCAAFRLKQFMHASMKTHEFNRAVQNLLMTAWVYAQARSYYYSDARIPTVMELGSTPLNEGIIVLNKIAQEFREDYGIEILNTVILTDGETTGTLRANNISGEVNLGRNTIIEDRKTRHQIKSVRDYRHTIACLKMYKHLTGSRVVGLFLMSGKNYKTQVSSRFYHSGEEFADPSTFEHQWKQQFVKHKYFALKQAGFDTYYMVPGSQLRIQDIDMDTAISSVNSSKNELLKAFKKMQNTKMVSRTFVNQFIKEVA